MILRIFFYLLTTLSSLDARNYLQEIVQNATDRFQDGSSKTGKHLFQYYYDSKARPLYDSFDKYHIDNEYDFIVVGSGTAGSVVANRLSEIRHWKILLIEVGPEPTKLNDVPGFGTYFLFTDYNYGFLMERQHDMCLGCVDQRMHWPRGRAIGGSSIINYMMHVRGNKIDYDRWAAMGNKGWSYEEVLPYFKKSEDYHVVHQDPPYHSLGGYLGVQEVPFRTESANVFVSAMQEYGYPFVDYNGEQQMGVSYIHATLRRGLRSSARRAFIDTARYRPNLTILPLTRVTKVLINPTTKMAYGVKFVHEKKTYYVKARKEVILSAGTINSAQLLMLSGVGPKWHLEEKEIDVIKDLPVGEKLYDHLTYLGLVATVNESIVYQASAANDPNAFLELQIKGAGPLTVIGNVEGIGFIRTPVSDDPEYSVPDIELIFIAAGFHTDRGQFSRRSYRVTDAQYNRIWRPLENKYAFTIWPMLFHPKSCGYLRLRSKNPFDRVKLYGNYLTDPGRHDIKTLIAAIREIQSIIDMPSFQKYDAKLTTASVVGCEHYFYDSDDYWECAIRHIGSTLHHQIATCRMGPEDDPEAVVDNELRVHGIKHLRVVDASIIPRTVSGHTNVPTYMIGERGSDFIKMAWLTEEQNVVLKNNDVDE